MRFISLTMFLIIGLFILPSHGNAQSYDQRYQPIYNQQASDQQYDPRYYQYYNQQQQEQQPSQYSQPNQQQQYQQQPQQPSYTQQQDPSRYTFTPERGGNSFRSNNKDAPYISIKLESVSLDSVTTPAVLGDPSSGNAAFDFENGLGLGIALGSNIGEQIRGELEFVYRDNSVDSISFDNPALSGLLSSVGDLSFTTYTTTVNVYYDFNFSEQWVPYIGGGLGFLYKSDERSEFEPVYQLMTGITYVLAGGNDIYGGYRYFSSGEMEENFDVELTAHILEFGYRFRF